MTKLLGVVGLFALVALACGSGDNTPTVKTPDANAPVETEAATEPVAAPVGTSRNNPAPAGSEVSQGDVSIVVVSVEDYTEQAVAANMFNSTPEPGNKYVLVHLKVTCNADKCDSFPTAEFNVVGDSGNLIQPTYAAGVEGLLEIQLEQLKGATAEGGLMFIVPEGETLVLVWEPIVGDTLYLALPG